MRLVLIILILFFNATMTYPQVKIYYDENCNITMRELATHYREAEVDTVSKVFVGQVKDFWVNDTLMTKLNYDSSGIRDGLFRAANSNGDLWLTGQYLNGAKLGNWVIYEQKFETIDFSARKAKTSETIDSAERCLTRKENFGVSRFIRKRDYPDIYSLISITHSAYDKNANWNIVEEPPYFPNGMQALGQFIGAFIKYPEDALNHNIKGQVIVEFTVTEDGSTTDFQIIKGLGYGCDEEAIRVLRLLPDWVPGYQHGKAVKTKLKLPITFG